MAIANQTYVDPSALAQLYIHQDGSMRITRWRAKSHGTLSVTHHGRLEIISAICRSVFAGGTPEEAMVKAILRFKRDFATGHLQQADLLWRAAIDRATELTQAHTPKLGTRSLDVLHVACALELKMRYFLTFDDRQQKLASAAGLKLVRL